MEIISWNVNGLRAAINKGFEKWVKERSPDILCLQEVRARKEDVKLNLEEYYSQWSFAEKKGYSGVTTFSKQKPIKFSKTLGEEKFDKEGRFLLFEYEKFFVINLYFPNAQRGLKRIDYRVRFNDRLLKYINNLRTKFKKGIILCGDFNAAHKEIDLKNPKQNMKNAGFSPEERKYITTLIENGYLDTFREFDPSPENYTWWTYRNNARSRNIGWRIDYFFVSEDLQPSLKSAFILKDVMGSDHCPVGINL